MYSRRRCGKAWCSIGTIKEGDEMNMAMEKKPRYWKLDSGVAWCRQLSQRDSEVECSRGQFNPGSAFFLVQRSIGDLPLGFSRTGHGVRIPLGIHLIIGLPQTNISSLELALTDVSDPNSPKYGQHLSKSDVSLRKTRVRSTLTKLPFTDRRAHISERREYASSE